ncbi:hypothetical protein VI817_009579 [Penicillium citrinum]|nr:hypothetical protein VI817_009579 [Penicillium citrinum]
MYSCLIYSYICGRPFPGCRCRQGDEVDADDPVFADEEENLALFLVAMDHAEMESALEAGRGTTVEAREAMSMAMAMNR